MENKLKINSATENEVIIVMTVEGKDVKISFEVGEIIEKPKTSGEPTMFALNSYKASDNRRYEANGIFVGTAHSGYFFESIENIIKKVQPKNRRF